MGQLLRLDRLTKSFDGVAAVRGLSLAVDEGETLGLVGPNGAGKSTLFDMVAGVRKPDSGTINFDGRDVTGLPPHSISSLGISRTFQTLRPFSRLTVIENVAAGVRFGGRRSVPRSKTQEVAKELLASVSLEHRAQELAGDIPLPDQRRLELARALATGPKLLMLDEAMAGLAHAETGEMVALLEKIRKERPVTIMVTEHSMKAIVLLCKRVVVMSQGEKIADGSPPEVLRDERVIAAYMGIGSAARSSPTFAAGDPGP